MTPITTAQELLLRMGVAPGIVFLAAHRTRQGSYTKKGSGRFHIQRRTKNIKRFGVVNH